MRVDRWSRDAERPVLFGLPPRVDQHDTSDVHSWRFYCTPCDVRWNDKVTHSICWSCDNLTAAI
jgi:hypothetical protein